MKTDIGSLPVEKDAVVTVQLHEEDLQALIRLLNVTSDAYTQAADNALKRGDSTQVSLLDARAKLAQIFSEQLNKYLDFAEPKSKERH